MLTWALAEIESGVVGGVRAPLGCQKKKKRKGGLRQFLLDFSYNPKWENSFPGYHLFENILTVSIL